MVTGGSNPAYCGTGGDAAIRNPGESPLMVSPYVHDKSGRRRLYWESGEDEDISQR